MHQLDCTLSGWCRTMYTVTRKWKESFLFQSTVIFRTIFRYDEEPRSYVLTLYIVVLNLFNYDMQHFQHAKVNQLKLFYFKPIKTVGFREWDGR